VSQDARIDQLLALVLELANGNLDARLETGTRTDRLDGVIEGLNMLAEELSASTAALMRSEASFRSLIERSPDAMFVHREERFVYANAAALALLGPGDPSQLWSSALPQLLQPKEPLASNLVATGDEATTHEARLICHDGAKLDLEVVSIPVNFDGRAATLTIARDISARKQLTAKMMEMDRMIAVGTLAAGVGHEINNPLAYVISNLDYALDGIRANGAVSPEPLAPMHQALVEAREGAERVRHIVRDLRTFSSTPETTVSTVELVPVLESAIHMAFNEIKHRAVLVREYEGAPRVRGCPSRLGQVFLNLLVNAAHAIPVGTASEHRVTVRASCQGNQVQIEVTDTGTGLAQQHLSRLFDPFFTTKPVGQGTGLGLFICRRIVSEHGGEIEVESGVGQGSTFRVRLPAASTVTQATQTMQAPELHVPPSRKRARVLVVDDEPGIGRSLARALGRDHDVSTVTCARDALGCLLEHDDFDAVLCDVMMPEMTGVDLYVALERSRPDLAARMLFITGGAFTPSTQAFVQTMADRCLEKPFDIRELRRKLEAFCSTGPA
jgi:PAS domain S-box-containing protein